ncbi:MAG: DUF1080 domain-containing protein [Sphingobacteriales bacterium]|nr:MAG: DUF1080 domain-containing protein [Sphingobacteriales bacterium]
MKLSMGMKVSTSLSLTPQLQQAIKLLQLSSLELEQEIQAQLDSNPLLEMIDPSDENPSVAESKNNETEANAESGDYEPSLTEQMQSNQLNDDLPVDTQWDDIFTHQSTALATPEFEEREDNRTNQEFGDIKLHLEWMTPLKPEARGQERGNSGVYLQDRYELQVLDSFGLDSKDNDAGGIYQITTPLENASLPPGQWQTYDITFRAPRLYTDGTIAKSPVITVLHNGVVIQKNIEIPRSTGGAVEGIVAKAPIRLQDHGNPVRYRNMWVQELTDQPWTPTAKPAGTPQ